MAIVDLRRGAGTLSCSAASLSSWRRHSCLPGRDSSRPSVGTPEAVTMCEPRVVSLSSWRRHSCLLGRDSSRPSVGTPEAVAMCEPRVAGNLACRRPFRPPVGLKARLQPRLAATQQRCESSQLPSHSPNLRRLQELGDASRPSLGVTASEGSVETSLGAADTSVCATSGVTEQVWLTAISSTPSKSPCATRTGSREPSCL